MPALGCDFMWLRWVFLVRIRPGSGGLAGRTGHGETRTDRSDNPSPDKGFRGRHSPKAVVFVLVRVLTLTHQAGWPCFQGTARRCLPTQESGDASSGVLGVPQF